MVIVVTTIPNLGHIIQYRVILSLITLQCGPGGVLELFGDLGSLHLWLYHSLGYLCSPPGHLYLAAAEEREHA